MVPLVEIEAAIKARPEKSGPITTVIINRPECHNAVDHDTAQLLKDAFEEFEADDGQAVAVLCDAGEHFCAGYDLTTVGDAQATYDPAGKGPLGPTRMLLSKPVICAVEGYAVAGGLELTLWSDIRIASETAIFGVFCHRWGVPLVDGGRSEGPPRAPPAVANADYGTSTDSIWALTLLSASFSRTASFRPVEFCQQLSNVTVPLVAVHDGDHRRLRYRRRAE